MKIAVYAICKNEEKHINRFVESCIDADYIIVGDTGSDDMSRNIMSEWEINFPRKFKYLNVNIIPFRFDDARNAVLAAIPADADMCIAMDMDEVLMPGWREHVETGFTKGANSIVFTFDPVTAPTFEQNNRIHSRAGFHWAYPAHEALLCSLHSEVRVYTAPGLVMQHLPDNHKPRNYLNLLAWGEWESPADPRMKFYYARELMFFSYFKEAIEKFDQYRELTIRLNYQHKTEIDDAIRFRWLCVEGLASSLNAGDQVKLLEEPAARLMDTDGL